MLLSILLHIAVNAVAPFKPQQSHIDITCNPCLKHLPFISAVFMPSFILTFLFNSTYQLTPYIPISNLYKTSLVKQLR